jgi:hypothetical protein
LPTYGPVLPDPVFNIPARCFELHDRTGVMQKNHRRQVIQNKVIPQKIKSKVDPHPGEVCGEYLPAVGAACNSTGNLPSCQSLPDMPAGLHDPLLIAHLVDRIRAAIQNNPDFLAEFLLQSASDLFNQRRACPRQAAPGPEDGSGGRIKTQGEPASGPSKRPGIPEGFIHPFRNISVLNQPSFGLP